jgi:hypothetical protein
MVSMARDGILHEFPRHRQIIRPSGVSVHRRPRADQAATTNDVMTFQSASSGYQARAAFMCSALCDIWARLNLRRDK